jgi:hypothetical protein
MYLRLSLVKLKYWDTKLTKTYLLSGQSNARGIYSDGYFPTNSHVTIWDNLGTSTDLNNLGTQWLTPNISNQPFDGLNNLGVNAAEKIYTATGEDVRFILVAKGSMEISSWYNGTPQAMLLRILAVLNAAGVTSLDGFWWHQGEQDNAIDPDDYLTMFTGILNTLKSNNLITDQTPVIMGETSINFPGSNLCLDNCLVDERTRLAPIRTFETGDGTHYLGTELVKIGSIYASYQLILERGDVMSNWDTFDDMSYDEISSEDTFAVRNTSETTVGQKMQTIQYSNLRKAIYGSARVLNGTLYLEKFIGIGGSDGLKPLLTNGCGVAAQIAMGTNLNVYDYLPFDADASEYAYFRMRMPNDYVGNGQIYFRYYWFHGATTTNFDVVFRLIGKCLTNGELLDTSMATAFGYSSNLVDTGGVTNTLYISGFSSLLTIDNSPAAGKLAEFRLYRRAVDAADTLAVDANLLGVTIYIPIL